MLLLAGPPRAAGSTGWAGAAHPPRRQLEASAVLRTTAGNFCAYEYSKALLVGLCTWLGHARSRLLRDDFSVECSPAAMLATKRPLVRCVWPTLFALRSATFAVPCSPRAFAGTGLKQRPRLRVHEAQGVRSLWPLHHRRLTAAARRSATLRSGGVSALPCLLCRRCSLASSATCRVLRIARARECMGLCASRAAYLCAVRQKVLGFQREVLFA